MTGNQTVSHSQSIFYQKNHFNFLKCCQFPILAIIMKIPKMVKIVYRQCPPLGRYPNKSPPPQAKARM